MKTVDAQYNWARWIVICPTCLKDGRTAAVEVKPGDVFVCPEEYPDLLAKTLVPNPRMPGAFNSVADILLRAEARGKAESDGNAFQVVFPKDKTKIECILRMRPREGRNWWPGVPLSDLVHENAERGVKNA